MARLIGVLHRTDLLTIGELAARSGFAPSALRYETLGLITLSEPPETSAATSGLAAPLGVHPLSTTRGVVAGGDHSGTADSAGKSYANQGRLDPPLSPVAWPAQ